jgi:anaerobic selenocysteine-containing dehydrogenase
MRRRVRDIRARGGRVVVVDPRRTETADAADQHLFIRPGTDALLLLSLIHVIFEAGLERPGRLGRIIDGVDTLRASVRDFSPEATAGATGVPAAEVRDLARAFATSTGAAYGRVGICTQAFGATASWLLYALNLVCGRLDEPGGMMFATPAVDVERLARVVGITGGFDRWRSRVRGLPEYGGELPVATLADEIEAPGPGQIRALIVSAGNPVLSTPQGHRLDRLLPTLDFIAAIDPYVNETSRHAHVILPPTSPLERSHYDVALLNFAVRNVAKFSPPVLAPPAGSRHDWEICLELGRRLGSLDASRGPVGRAIGGAAHSLLAWAGPERLLDVALRLGPYGLGRGVNGLSLRKLRRAPHGIDLGPLESRLPARLRTSTRRIDLAPRRFLDDLVRVRPQMVADRPPLVLIGRRHLHSNNSWCHNVGRLVKGKPRCTLLINPSDAAARGIADGDLVAVSSRTGRIEVPAATADGIMAGVVSLPHGWGHDRDGVELRIARRIGGASVNDITDADLIDPVSGNAALSGVAVEIERVPRAPGVA